MPQLFSARAEYGVMFKNNPALADDTAPEGIDVYFDNGGGKQLAAAVVNAQPFGRIILCGIIGNEGIALSLDALPLDIALRGKNLNRNEYNTFRFGPYNSGVITGYRGDTHTFGLTATYRFGE